MLTFSVHNHQNKMRNKQVNSNKAIEMCVNPHDMAVFLDKCHSGSLLGCVRAKFQVSVVLVWSVRWTKIKTRLNRYK